MVDATPQIERVFREEYGRVVASLVRRFGDIDVAEEAAGEALVVALEKWPTEGVPPNPGGWLTTTAGNKGIDRIRREQQRDTKHRAAQLISEDTPHEPTGIVEDDRLRLMFTCCHPALAPEARVALTLRLLGGLTVAEIAQAFLMTETTMAQRSPAPRPRSRRRTSPTECLTTPTSTNDWPASLRSSIWCSTRATSPGDHEVAGLLALMLLVESRRDVRIAGDELVPLHEQDRGGWDRALIAEGHDLVRECLRANRPGQYQLLAAINAVHTDATAHADTDWGRSPRSTTSSTRSPRRLSSR